MNNENKSPWQQIDYTLLFIIFLLMCVSLLALSTVNNNFVINQLVWYIVGTVALAGTMIIDFDRFRQFAWYLYGFGIFLLLGLVLAKFSIIPSCKEGCIAISEKGAVSWYNVPAIGSFQPSELMKIFLFITLSHLILKHHERYIEKTVKTDLLLVGKIFLVSGIPIVMTSVQPDLGTTMVLVAITTSLLLVSGIKWRLLFLMASGSFLSFVFVILLYNKFPNFWLFDKLFGHVESRIYGWLWPYENPSDQGFQLIKALDAIGSGQLYGRGYEDGIVDIPVAYSDFIFAVIAEEFGFLGASIVISLFFVLVYRIIHTALDTRDPFGSYLCTGIIGMLTFQVFQNIGMSIQVLPITGIPLPFISYGGTSLLTYMITIGIVLNVHSRKKQYMFE